MQRVLVRMRLAEGAIDARLYTELVRRQTLGFPLLELSSDALRPRRTVRFSESALDRLAGASRVHSARVSDRDGHLFAFHSLGSGHHAHQLVWTPTSLEPVQELVRSVVSLPGFSSAYIGDREDEFWQSETSPDNYKAFGRPHDHLPKTSEGNLRAGEERIDIRGNWGRGVPLGPIWLWAASTMWFGPPAFRLLDRSRLLALPVGTVREQAGGRIRVDLFPYEWYETDIDAARDRQRTFWDWMRLLDLEAREYDIRNALPQDPDVEMETGEFPHGGVRLITEWLDESQLGWARRSEAAFRRTTELSPDGDVVWQEVQPAE